MILLANLENTSMHYNSTIKILSVIYFFLKKNHISVNLLINLNVFSSHLETIEPHMLAEHFWEEKIPRKDGIAIAQ